MLNVKQGTTILKAFPTFLVSNMFLCSERGKIKRLNQKNELSILFFLGKWVIGMKAKVKFNRKPSRARQNWANHP
jgi:hypothetical protein